MNQLFREGLNAQLKALMYDIRTAWLRPDEWQWGKAPDLDLKPWYGSVLVENYPNNSRQNLPGDADKVEVLMTITCKYNGEEVTVAEMLRRADA